MGHVGALVAAATALVLTVGMPAAGRTASNSTGAPGFANGALLPFGTGGPDDVTVDAPAAAQATSALLAGPLSEAGLVSPVDNAVASSLASGGIPATALDAYRRAADSAPASCHISWTLIAAIGRVESNHGRFGGAVLHADGVSTPPILGPRLDGNGFASIPDTDGGRLDGDTAYDRAVGPMQFIPSTWAAFGRDGNGDGKSDPFNIYDAAGAAAAYLCTAGGDLSTVAGQQRAVLAYNHSDSYVATVLGLAAQYAGEVPPVIGTAPPVPTELPPVNPGPPPALPAAALAPPASSASQTSAPPANVAAAATSPQAPSSSSSSSPSSTSAAPTTSSSAGTSAGPTTTPPSSSAPSGTPTTTPPTTTPPSSSSATPTPTPAPTPTSTATTSSTCPVDPGTTTPVTVDVIDATGNAANGNNAMADLKAAGLTAGTLSTGTGKPSAIQYPAALQEQARQLATDLDQSGLLASADVPHITVVLGSSDSAPLLAALHRAAASPVCPAH